MSGYIILRKGDRNFMPFINRVDRSLLTVFDYPALTRLGQPNDGGYVIPEDAIKRSKCMLSFGIGQDWKFEKDVQRLNPEILIHAYDYSVGKKFFRKIITHAWVTVLLRVLCFNFHGAWINIGRWLNAVDYFRFFQGNVRHFKKRVWYNTDRGSAAITDIIKETGCKQANIIFAKMDIEGSEYRILPYIIDEAAKFSGLVVEFHDIDICSELFNDIMGRLTTQFYIVHIHGNNMSDLSVDHELPNTLEISFIHKNLVGKELEIYKGTLPREGLDAPNGPSSPDYKIIPFLNEDRSYSGKKD
jgi:hypothetical protein